MKELHILVTGIGRRVELLQAFRQAALKLNINLKLYGADMTGTAPALVFCDYIRKICSMNDTHYIQQLLNICLADNINLILPTIDTDLLVLSQNIEVFEKVGVKVLISKVDKILICRDKNYTGDFFKSCGLYAPRTYNNYKEYHDSYPCFIKPKDGSSSTNAFKVKNAKELEVYANQIKDYIVQPFIEGREFTIDIFCDFEGNPIFITPRERLQVRAGEVIKTQIYMDKKMIEESKKIIEYFKPCGPITVQLIQDKNTGKNYYIEINPRYGGGVPLSMKSGARSAEALLKLLCGEEIGYQELSCNGSIYSRFEQSVCISYGNIIQPIKGVIFSLDNTLYNERQYVKNSCNKNPNYLKNDKLWNLLPKEKYKTTKSKEIHKSRISEITLHDEVIKIISKLRKKNIKIGIITDGLPEIQRKTIMTLGLEEIFDDIIITDELGGIQFRKPNDISFRILQNRWKVPFEQIVCVGDNPLKDFQAPWQLGMKSLYFKNQDCLYSDTSNVIAAQMINSFTEMESWLL